MAITIDDLAADLQQFFAQKFPPGSGEGPGSVQLIFDALGTPLDPGEFVGSGTNSAQDILAHQRAAQLADQLPAANMLSAGWYVAKSGSRLSRWYENILSGSTALSSNPDDLKAFEALKQAALHRFAENKLVLVSGAAVGGSAGTVDAVGVHDSYYATSMSPIDWFQASATCWETYKSSAHDNQPIPIDTPPLSKRPTFALRVAVQDDNPALMKFLDRAVVSGLSVNEAISPASQVEPIAAATPIARLAPMHMAERTISSAAIESIALTPQITNNMIIGQSIAVSKPLVAESVELRAARLPPLEPALIHDATTAQPLSSNNFDVSFDYCIVRFDRPWWDEMFTSSHGWHLFGFEPGEIASGSSTNPAGALSLITIGMLVVKNLVITATWSGGDLNALKKSTSIGPFCIAGAAFNGSIGSLTRVGTQVIAWLCQVPPPLPPNVAHGVQPQASTGDLVTTTPPVVNVAGNWHDSDGFTYTFEQKGSEFSYTQSQNGAQVGTGAGTIEGNTMHYTFQSGGSAGGCIGQVSADNQSISGTCSSGDQNWPFSITR